MKEQTEKKNKGHSFWRRNQRLVIIVLVLLLIIIAALIIFYPTRLKHISEQNTEDTNNIKITAIDDQSSNNSANVQPAAKTAADYYNEGQALIAQKKWQEAISALDEAIKLDPNNVQYYIRKSEAEYLSGDKQAAISTTQQGLAIDPNNQLLLSKLDILQKESFNNQQNDGRN